MINQGQKLMLLIKKADKHSKDIAKELSITPQHLARLYKKINLDKKFIERVCELLEISEKEFDVEMEVGRLVSRPNICYINVPVYAGEGESENEEVEYGYLEDVQGIFYGLKVSGNSMSPTIEEGDCVLCTPINNRQDLENNKIYVVAQKGKAPQVKRLRYEISKAYLQSDNGFYKPELLNYEDNEVRFYRVTHRISSI